MRSGGPSSSIHAAHIVAGGDVSGCGLPGCGIPSKCRGSVETAAGSELLGQDPSLVGLDDPVVLKLR